MAMELSWLHEGYILLAKYTGEVTPEDIRRQYVEGIEMSHTSDAPMVHLIADFRDVGTFPMSVRAYKGTFGEKARNAGWVIMVGNNKLVRFLASLVSNTMGLRMTYLTTMEEAIKYVALRDPNFNYEDVNYEANAASDTIG